MRFNVKKFFFTPVGLAVLVISLVILINALITRNAYEIVLSVMVIFLMLVLGSIGAYTSYKLKELEPFWKPPYPFTARAGEPVIISGLEANIPLFFRLHFEVKGKYSIAQRHSGAEQKVRENAKINNYFNDTSIARGESAAELIMDFPMSGVFQGEGICKLRDIFGLFSFTCGKPQPKTLNIRCSPCFGKEQYINAQSGAEDRRNKQSTDEERYYMREYTPGDRLRDINWKSSEKIDTLITRISPDNQEKVNRIEIYFRNYRNTQSKGSKKPLLEELWLLDRAKAQLSFFLRSLREQQSSFIFDVKFAGGSREIEDEESLDEFLEELAGISFAPVRNEEVASNKKGEIYVFSTACDIGLQTFLLAVQPRLVNLNLILCARFVESAASPQEKIEILHKRDFLLKGIILPPRLLKRSKIKPMNVQTAKTEIIYAGTKL